jgi:hypothetical protein
VVKGNGPTRSWFIIAPLPAGRRAAVQEKKQMNSIVMNKDNYSIFDIFVKARIITGKSRQLSISNEKGTKIEIAVFNITSLL